MKVVLIRYNWKKVINIVLKSEMDQFLWDNFFLQMAHLLWDGGSNKEGFLNYGGKGEHAQ